ncbi:hypothetical protein TRFO_06880 [Tritrichomonas foetus]|uniref:Uncharacterized protein n=1 Tax=Tritrichomonas foetus TaxID=1144522 RepID=A0A1J4JVW5_9EUKA|nr:hypothetical protein TRFO_06880 [Tritrichomonas foetus]|eukprot:OHT02850.1 hypothetical protein TRFO_06880 [Tritrichomonas foetus]
MKQVCTVIYDSSQFVEFFQSDDHLSLSMLLSSFMAGTKFIEIDDVTLPQCLQQHPSLIDLASFYGAIECVRFLCINDTINLSHFDKIGRTTVHYAAMNGNVQIILLLREFGFDMMHTDEEGRTPLHYVIMRNNLNAIQYLMINFIPSYDPNISQHYAHYAASVGSNFEVIMFISYFFNCVDFEQPDENHISFYEKAIDSENFDFFSFLLDHNIKQITDDKGYLPIHMAAERDLPEFIEALLEKENYKNKDYQNEDEIKDQFPEGNILNSFYESSTFDNFWGQNDLYDFNDISLVHKVDNKGCTPLHIAAQKGSFESALILIQNGADVDAIDNEERTPMHYAAIGGHLAIVELLYDVGADLQIFDVDMKTPANYAYIRGRTCCVRFFSEIGCIEDNEDIILSDYGLGHNHRRKRVSRHFYHVFARERQGIKTNKQSEDEIE